MAGDEQGQVQGQALSKAQRALQMAKAKREDIFARAQAFHDTAKKLTQENYANYGAMLTRLNMLRERFEAVQFEIMEKNMHVETADQLPIASVSIRFDEVAQEIEAIFDGFGANFGRECGTRFRSGPRSRHHHRCPSSAP